MKILVIGGSYFLGKTFVDLAMDYHEIYVANRGNSPLGYEDVVELIMDRHNVSDLSCAGSETYDVVVDFCAYSKGDIKLVCEHIKGFNQYIFISTCDVYKRGTGCTIHEDTPYEERDFGGAAGEYISGKVALEKELVECAQMYNFRYTSVRPAFIYGPNNYAPRENMYFEWIMNAGQIIHPYDAEGEFYMTFVLDVARAIFTMCGNDRCYDEAYNICPDKPITYEDFTDILETIVEYPFEIIKVSVMDVYNKNIPLPFPLTKGESEHYSNEKIKKLGFEFTDILSGMRATANYYLGR